MANPEGQDLKGRFPVTRAEKWQAPLNKKPKFFGRFDSLLTADLFSESLRLHEKKTGLAFLNSRCSHVQTIWGRLAIRQMTRARPL